MSFLFIYNVYASHALGIKNKKWKGKRKKLNIYVMEEKSGGK